MKRTSCVLGFVLVIALILFSIGGCTPAAQGQADAERLAGTSGLSAYEPSQAPAPETPVGTDYTIDVDGYAVDSATAQPGTGGQTQSSHAFPAQTVSDLDRAASLIVTGKVVSTEFFSQKGSAYIKVDLAVDSVIKGGIVPGDKISVVTFGGYISIADHVSAFQNGFRFEDVPEQEWATTYIYEGAPALGFPEPGDSYAYFLAEEPMFDKAYWPVNDDEGMFRGGDDGKYTRINPVEGYAPSSGEKVIDSFTLDDLRRYFGK